MHAVTMKWESLRDSLQTYIQSLEQFDSAAPKNLNQNLFIILLLKITIIHWLMHAVTMKWESLRDSLQTYIQSLEQFDSAAPKNLNQNLFIILLLKITIIHWLMHAVAMKWESLHRKNYFWRFNFLVGTKSTSYSSNECYVHCWNIIYTVFQWNVLALKWIEYQRLMGSQEKWNCVYSCLQIWASTLKKKLAASPDLVTLWFWW